jgi:hypothetical protein
MHCRDFYIYTAIKEADAGLFKAEGFSGSNKAQWSTDVGKFKR